MLNQIPDPKFNSLFLSLTPNEYILIMQALEIYHHANSVTFLAGIPGEQRAMVEIVKTSLEALHARLAYIVTAEYAEATKSELLKNINDGKYNPIK